MPATERRRWTAHEVRELIDASPLATPRYELIDGELLVTPSPGGPHQDAVLRLAISLDAYLASNPIGRVMISPSDVELEPETIVQPDVFVLSTDEWMRLRTERTAHAMLLAIEILSPASSRHDRGRKRRLYQRSRVAEHWIVDLDARLVERWLPGDERPQVLHGLMEWRPAGSTNPLVIDLDGFFAGVFGEQPR